MRTSDQTRPETLLAAVNTFFADMVILPPAVLTQEERPFQPPLLASAHRQSCSGTSRPDFLPSGGLCSAHSRFPYTVPPYPGYPYPGFPYMALPYPVKAYLGLTAVRTEAFRK